MHTEDFVGGNCVGVIVTIYGMMSNLTKQVSVLKMSFRYPIGVIQKIFKSLKTLIIKYGITIS